LPFKDVYICQSALFRRTLFQAIKEKAFATVGGTTGGILQPRAHEKKT